MQSQESPLPLQHLLDTSSPGTHSACLAVGSRKYFVLSSPHMKLHPLLACIFRISKLVLYENNEGVVELSCDFVSSSPTLDSTGQELSGWSEKGPHQIMFAVAQERHSCLTMRAVVKSIFAVTVLLEDICSGERHLCRNCSARIYTHVLQLTSV